MKPQPSSALRLPRTSRGRDRRPHLAVEGLEDRALLAISFSPLSPLAVGTGPGYLATGSFSGNNLTDVLTANTQANSLSLVPGQAGGTFGTATTVPLGFSPAGLAAADFNGDGKLDAAVLNAAAGQVAILPGQGNGTFGTPVTFNVGTGASGILAGDVNGDNRTDLAVANAGAGTVAIYPNTGNGTFANPLTINVGPNPQYLTAADFNSDGRPDLAVSNVGQKRITVIPNLGNGQVGNPVLINLANDVAGLTAVNARGSANPYLAVTNPSNSSVTVIPNNGNFQFGTPTVINNVGSTPTQVTAADFDGTGLAGLAVVDDGSSNIYVIPNAGNGTFGAPMPFTVGVAPRAIATAPFTANNLPGIFVANSGSNDVSVLANTTSTGPVAISPTVTSVQRFGFHNLPTFIAVNFSMPLNPNSANNVANYHLYDVGANGQFADDFQNATPVPLASAQYNPTTNQVLLTPQQTLLYLYHQYELVINGTSPNGISGANGAFLTGNNGVGTNYTKVFGPAALAGPQPGTLFNNNGGNNNVGNNNGNAMTRAERLRIRWLQRHPHAFQNLVAHSGGQNAGSQGQASRPLTLRQVLRQARAQGVTTTAQLDQLLASDGLSGKPRLMRILSRRLHVS